MLCAFQKDLKRRDHFTHYWDSATPDMKHQLLNVNITYTRRKWNIPYKIKFRAGNLGKAITQIAIWIALTTWIFRDHNWCQDLRETRWEREYLLDQFLLVRDTSFWARISKLYSSPRCQLHQQCRLTCCAWRGKSFTYWINTIISYSA